MTDSLSYDEQCLLKLISSALTDNSGVFFEKSPNWSVVCKLAKCHAVCSLLYNVLADRADLSEEIKQTVVNESRRTVLQSYRLLFLSRAIIDLLKEIGVPALLLKGSCVAKLYPAFELRKAGDVDILILKPERIDDVCRKLEALGLTIDSEQHSVHHIGLKSPDNIEVEIHTMLAEPFDSKKVNRYISATAVQSAVCVVNEDIMGVGLPRLADAYQAYSLLLHMLQHFLRSGFGLKLLCDWSVFWNYKYNKETETLYLKLVNESGVKGFSDIVTRTCVRFLGLKYENIKFMFYNDSSDDTHEADIMAFMREVLDAEEFGKSEKGRMVALRGTNIFDYIREFHHQTCLNFPKASKVFLLCPMLWTVTLWRFLRNNHKLRGVSTHSILKSARKRGKLIKNLKLFDTV